MSDDIIEYELKDQHKLKRKNTVIKILVAIIIVLTLSTAYLALSQIESRVRIECGNETFIESATITYYDKIVADLDGDIKVRLQNSVNTATIHYDKCYYVRTSQYIW